MSPSPRRRGRFSLRVHLRPSTVPLLVFAFAALPLAAAPAAAGPTDNPVATYYNGPEGYPAWTDQIHWARVINMKTYSKGATHFEKFENARDELAAQGGGVLYYPAGAYEFTAGPFDGPAGRGLMLRGGVVIRGEAPPRDRVKPAAGAMDLPTKFVFGFSDRSKVAIDAGDRLRITLKGGGLGSKDRDGKEWREDLRLSLRLKDGKPAADDPYICWRSETIACKATVAPGEPIAVQAEAALPDKAPVDVKYSVKISPAGQGLFKGTFEGRVGEAAVQGDAAGRITQGKPETPRDWNLIGLMPEKGQGVKDVHNVGLCWVNAVGAIVYFGPQVNWGRTWRTAGSWKSDFVKDSWAQRVPDGTHPDDPFSGGGKNYVGAGKGRLVFGCVFDRAVGVNNGMTCGTQLQNPPPEAARGFGDEGFYMYKFAPRIGVYGSRVFVAANVLPISSGFNFKYRQTTLPASSGKGHVIIWRTSRQSTVLFDYSKACGIDVNKDMLGLVRESILEPSSNQGYYEEGVVVRDNYVYNFGHKGYNLSGRWMTVVNNVNQRDVLRLSHEPYGLGGWRLTLDGYIEVTGGGHGAISDTLSRAFDIGGQNVWIDGNFYNNLGSAGNDGEGILSQAHGGTHLYSWGVTRNKHEKGQGNTSYIGGWNVKAHGCLIAWNELPGAVGQHMSVDEEDCAYVGNKAGGVASGKSGNALIAPPAGTPKPPTDVKAEAYQGDAVKIAWTDASDNEIGFRVQRSLDGGKAWTTIAYRPPQIQKNADNPPAWVDVTAPSNKPCVYRVVAVGVEDTDDGASAPTAPITVTVRK